MMKGYKAFNADLTCNGFQYEVGKTYEMEDCELCVHGFHFCKNIADCFKYYSSYNARFAEVEALGDIMESDEDSKCVTNKIRILEEIPRSTAFDMSNTGNRNTGNSNTGNRNTGNRNTGNRNTGDRNTGDCNTGDWNTGDWNTTNFSSGCFNTEKQTIIMFNKPSKWTLSVYKNSRAAQLLYWSPKEIDMVEWVESCDMTEEEKKENPSHETIGGYLRVTKSNGDRQEWWNNLDDDDKNEILSLPNFDKDIFKECTGIEVGK